MFKNYFKIAVRNLIKHKATSFINIFGLGIGMAGCLLILQYVSFELSYDQFNAQKENIYRVINDRYQQGKLSQHGPMTYSAIGKAMKDDYPEEIENYARVGFFWDRILINGDKKTREGGLAVDNSFLSMFSYPLLAGDRSKALQEPNAIIVSETLARKIFGPEDLSSLIGRSLMISMDSVSYQVTGVCKDVPENSHLQFAFLVSYSTLYTGGNGFWKSANHSFKISDFWQYIQLKPGVDYKRLQAKFGDFSQRHFQGTKVSGSDEKFYLQPLERAHLYSNMEYDLAKTGNATAVWGLLVIAFFIIVIAWVNYINLATAKSIERAKEVGIRKVAGAQRSELVRQFLTESICVNVLSLLFALLVLQLVQPYFNDLVGRDLSLPVLFEKGLNGYSVTISLLLFIIAGILVSGFYPALVLSSFKPITVLKGKLSHSSKGGRIRKALVIGQFAITIVLIAGSLVVYRQVRFMNNQQLGLNIDQVMVVNPPVLTDYRDMQFNNRMESFKDAVKKITAVKGATASRVPGQELGRLFDVHRVEDNARHAVRTWGVNHDFIDVYGLKLLAGRNFTPADHNENLSKVHNLILNEQALGLLGFDSPESAIGRQVVAYNRTWDVIGVAANFHQKSLRHAIEPTILTPNYNPNSAISLKVQPGTNPDLVIDAVRREYAKFFPGNLFDYYFLDDKFNEQYKDDRLFGRVFALFAGFAIFIASLGLLGLSLFATSQRIKEIGVRKVLGASSASLVLLLSRDFIRLVLIACVIAFPVAWYTMQNWLNDFPYRINLSWAILAIAAIIALAIALVTISSQTIKAAMANPVKSLRTE